MDISLAKNKSVAELEEDGTVVHVRDESGEKQYVGEGDEKTPVTITVVGTYSATYRRASDANRDRMLKRRSVDGDHLYQQSLDLAAACIKAWDGLTSAGLPYPLTKQNAIALLDSAPWIREQVEAAMTDHASFFKGSSPR